MRWLLSPGVLVALSGCAESSKERLERFDAEADIDCWSYYCPGTMPGPTPQPIDQVVACMNDALASGARAKASWGAENFAAYTYDGTRVFTVDHRVKIFTVHVFGEEPSTVEELPDCSGPFRVGPSFCGYGGFAMPVFALDWDCPPTR